MSSSQPPPAAASATGTALIHADALTDGLTAHALDEAALAAAAAACADEPIRIPGSIQPHGHLLVVRPAGPAPSAPPGPPALTVLSASAGAARTLGAAASAGADLADLSGQLADLVRSVIDGGGDQTTTIDPVELPVGSGRRHHAVAHRITPTSSDSSQHPALVVVELEPARGDEGPTHPWHLQLPAVLRRLQDAGSVTALAESLATGVRELTGFDRVMVYRFDEEWNGEVLAEDRRADLEPFLGLRYPATDIPAQARALYARQWLRIIPTSSYAPVPLEPAEPTGEPLDLSLAVLRSVSPVHLQYLRNMGVAASMSISLLHGDRLWGLIACHHYAGPHRPSVPVRTAAEFLGRTASLLLPVVVGRETDHQVVATSQVRARLTELLADSPEMALEALTREDATIADLVPCGGVALRIHGELRLLGATPPPAVVAALSVHLADGPLVTSSLAATALEVTAGLEPEDVWATASGVLAAPIAGGQPGDLIAWFRPEVLQEIIWGGDPRSSTLVSSDDGTVRLSPRHSFDAWSETVRRTAQRWTQHEVDAALGFARHLSDSLLREVERTSRLARALQQTLLLEKLPEVPGLDLAVRYVPHSDDIVGGDWYDIVPLSDGCTAVVLGDVAGHGLAASAISAQMRNALRAYVLASRDPAQALGRLNELVTRLLTGELATAVVVVIDQATGAARIVNAGHPPLVVRSGDGTARLVDDGARGPAVGLLDDVEYTTTEVQLEPGGALLLFSDGLVEERRTAWTERLERVVRTVSGDVGSLDELCDKLLRSVSARADDTTVLAVSWVPTTR
ncbi:PAS fold-containing protein [Quadrisphaera granulorum]|uniref:PAS domain-containing protein n=1 Tax=Quadrisphaera granulorum TaxID=317664 RepID=A0A316AAB7_9ACTN|nr:SpoIIE family protein phosphatase [Quadrisphaera granulorum]PWJ54623.1 PAS domain-containing protein [Quadrisphaera granulorum]SZE95985.1 PAS fold-containing protein [Quadrisphaera granulorum]